MKWRRGPLIGRGAFGKVYVGLDEDTGIRIAIKEIESSDDSEKVENEIEILRELDHENIVKYFGYETDNEGKICVFLEYIAGGTIHDLIKDFGPLNEHVVALYTRQMLQGLCYLHKHRVAHRDIKGANVLISPDGKIKLSDFGSAKQILQKPAENNNQLSGTPFWMAPEVIQKVQPLKVWKKADVWSIGCTVVEMLTGSTPWPKFSNPFAALYHIANTKNRPTLPPNISNDCQEFLTMCFIASAEERPTAIETLNLEFVAKLKSDEDSPRNYQLELSVVPSPSPYGGYSAEGRNTAESKTTLTSGRGRSDSFGLVWDSLMEMKVSGNNVDGGGDETSPVSSRLRAQSATNKVDARFSPGQRPKSARKTPPPPNNLAGPQSARQNTPRLTHRRSTNDKYDELFSA